MKLCFMLLALCSTNLFATTTLPDMPMERCDVTCHTVGHTFSQHGRFSICQEVLTCDLLAWNEEQNVCELQGTETRKQPIQCRDIPPVTF